MANLHSLFQEYLNSEQFNLPVFQKENITTEVESVIKKLKNEFQKLRLHLPENNNKSSRSILKDFMDVFGKKEIEFDDFQLNYFDKKFLSKYRNKNIINWAIVLKSKGGNEGRRTPNTYLAWLKSSLNEDNKQFTCKDNYLDINLNHHIVLRLHLYFKVSDTHELAYFSTNNWEHYDPKEFEIWANKQGHRKEFFKEVNYLILTWYYNTKQANNLPDNLEKSLLVLVAKNYLEDNSRIDKSFAQTIESIRDKLKSNFQCLLPTTPVDMDLLESITLLEKDAILSSLSKAADTANQALINRKNGDAGRKWLQLFGNSFPYQKAANLDVIIAAASVSTPTSSSQPKTYTKPTTIRRNAKSA